MNKAAVDVVKAARVLVERTFVGKDKGAKYAHVNRELPQDLCNLRNALRHFDEEAEWQT